MKGQRSCIAHAADLRESGDSGGSIYQQGQSLQNVCNRCDHLIEKQGGKEELLLQCGQYNQNPKYESTAENVTICWTRLILHTVLYALFAVGALEYVDKDKR